jgi:hypothetical protein
VKVFRCFGSVAPEPRPEPILTPHQILFMVQIRRPFALINSRMFVHAQESQLDGSHDSSMIVGEVQQEWHPWRRKYNVFKK